MDDILKWVPTHGSNIPDNAVLGGQDSKGRPLFVARAIHNEYYCPGKAGNHLGGCHTGSDWIEKEYDKYDVLTIPPEAEHLLSWERDRLGHLPQNAVAVSPSSPLYIGRHPHAGGMNVGKIDIRNKAIYVTHGGREIQYYHYEVLVCNKPNSRLYNLHNIHYDLLSAQVHTDNHLVELKSQSVPHLTNDKSICVPYSKTLSHQWNIDTDIKHGTIIQVTACIPVFMESKFTISPQTCITTTYGHVHKDVTKAFIDKKMTISPKTGNRVSVVAYQQFINVPYTASLTKFENNDKDVTTQTSGMYHCSTYTDYQISSLVLK